MIKAKRRGFAILALVACSLAGASENDANLQPDRSVRGMKEAAGNVCEHEDREAMSSNGAAPKGLRYEKKVATKTGPATWSVTMIKVAPGPRGATKTPMSCDLKDDGVFLSVTNLRS